MPTWFSFLSLFRLASVYSPQRATLAICHVLLIRCHINLLDRIWKISQKIGGEKMRMKDSTTRWNFINPLVCFSFLHYSYSFLLEDKALRQVRFVVFFLTNSFFIDFANRNLLITKLQNHNLFKENYNILFPIKYYF